MAPESIVCDRTNSHAFFLILTRPAALLCGSAKHRVGTDWRVGGFVTISEEISLERPAMPKTKSASAKRPQSALGKWLDAAAEELTRALEALGPQPRLQPIPVKVRSGRQPNRS
jgi:hypothetical protein